MKEWTPQQRLSAIADIAFKMVQYEGWSRWQWSRVYLMASASPREPGEFEQYYQELLSQMKKEQELLSSCVGGQE